MYECMYMLCLCPIIFKSWCVPRVHVVLFRVYLSTSLLHMRSRWQNFSASVSLLLHCCNMGGLCFM